MTNIRFQLRNGTTVATDVYVNAPGSLEANGAVMQKVNLGTWYTVKLVANPAASKYDLYVNDTVKASGIPFSSPVTSLDTIRFSTGVANKNSLYIDDVAIYGITPPTWASNKSLTYTSRNTNSISLSWSGVDDTTVTYYVYNGTSLSHTVAGATYATISGLSFNTNYDFTVQAADAFGNVSTDGPTLAVATTSSSSRSSGSSSSGGGVSADGSGTSTSVIVGADGSITRSQPS
ncbi:fibronectin type III domain-containing protein [Paenibacillus baimaensis]|uniref:fibronectin type III domain-containing protein n=1 Tax=Paenibacillus baimaensis TaxID=2982185 RepID=UPI0021D26B38|nr:fibronectin type III domain-containing protein [Paenibacillus sp. WQ 127069]